MTDLDIADCINETCPWSGEPVQADSLAGYGGKVASVLQSRLPRPVRGRYPPLRGGGKESRPVASCSPERI